MKKLLVVCGLLGLVGCGHERTVEVDGRVVPITDSYKYNYHLGGHDDDYRHLQWRFEQVEKKIDALESKLPGK
jgi:hypothetical protein